MPGGSERQELVGGAVRSDTEGEKPAVSRLGLHCQRMPSREAGTLDNRDSQEHVAGTR